MEPIIWYILVVNGLVLVGQGIISVIFFYFSWKTSKTIQQAIKDVDKRLADKKMLNDITKKLDAKFGGRMSKFSKKIQTIQQEAGIEDNGFMGLVFDALNHDEGIIDYAVKNKGTVGRIINAASNKKEPEIPEDMEGPPDWWSEDDDNAVQDAINDVVEQRKKAHGEGTK